MLTTRPPKPLPKIFLIVLILELLQFLYVLVTTNTEPIKCNDGANDIVDGQDHHEGNRKGFAKHQPTSKCHVALQLSYSTCRMWSTPTSKELFYKLTELQMFLVTVYKGSNMFAVPGRYVSRHTTM
jgi:hypothetical protein